MPELGKTLIFAGVSLCVVGVLLLYGDRMPFRLGQLPGDIAWKGKNGAVYFPVVTCLMLSVLGSLILWLLGKR